MFLSENYNTSKQKYGEKIVKELSDIGIPSRYLLSACRFYQEGVSIINLKKYFRQWMTYVVKNKNIDVNGLSFEQFYQTIQKYKRQSLNANNIYDDGKVSIRKIVDFNDMKNLPFANYWCTRKRKYWDEYSSKEPPPNFYLVTNNNYTESSNCRYVMIEMYPNGEIGYWSTNNELIDENGNSGRLPKLSEYQKSLGNAFQKIKEIQGQITENKQYNKNNNMKRTIKLNESDLHRIIKEYVNKILKEMTSISTKIPNNIKRNVELMCDNFKQYGDCILSDEKTVEICTKYGHGVNAVGYEFAAMPFPNQENKLKELINNIKTMGFEVNDYSKEYSNLENEGFYVFTFGYGKY